MPVDKSYEFPGTSIIELVLYLHVTILQTRPPVDLVFHRFVFSTLRFGV